MVSITTAENGTSFHIVMERTALKGNAKKKSHSMPSAQRGAPLRRSRRSTAISAAVSSAIDTSE